MSLEIIVPTIVCRANTQINSMFYPVVVLSMGVTWILEVEKPTISLAPHIFHVLFPSHYDHF